MGWIGVAPTGNITPRASGQTSIWSCITRELGQPLKERKQMTAVATLTGALSDRMTVWRLQARMVKVVPDTWHDRVPQGAFARLELLEGKLSRAVLRGLDGSNPARLPGGMMQVILPEFVDYPQHLHALPADRLNEIHQCLRYLESTPDVAPLWRLLRPTGIPGA